MEICSPIWPIASAPRCSDQGDARLKSVSDAHDFFADMFSERDFAIGHLREFLFDRLGQFTGLIARGGAVIVARFHGAQAAFHALIEGV